MKLNKSDILTTRFGGVIPIVKEMIRRGMPELIDSSLAEEFSRKHNSKYKFSDMFISWIASALCGATRIDHVTGLKEDLEVIPGLNVPSHDTMGRLMKALVAPIIREDYVSQEAVTPNEYDENIPLNSLLIKMTVASGALERGREYILDVDCSFIHTSCMNAAKDNKDVRQGFNPMICLIGNLPVFIAMRNGNSGADFREKQCIEQCLDLLEKEGIRVKMVRTDGAGYREAQTKMINDRNTLFLTASPVNAAFKKMFAEFDKCNWNKTIIETANEFKECEVAEISYSMTNLTEKWRVIAQRIPVDPNVSLSPDEVAQRQKVERQIKKLAKEGKYKSHQKRFSPADWNVVRDYKYKMIATNDFETPAVDLIKLYNQRGDAEKKFSYMKQDFGWKYPPFMRMNENTVFLIVSSMANNIFRAMAEHFNVHIDDLELNARIRRFQKAFIDTIAICINGNWTYYNTKIDFEKIA